MTTIARASTRAEFEAALHLMAEMARWDVDETGKLGFPTDGLLELYYPDTLQSVEAMFTAPRSVLLFAQTDGVASGILGVKAIDATVAEICKFYVKLSFRGQAIGASLLRTAFDFSRQEGFAALRLETARFMTSAIALYAAHGFKPCESYYDLPADYRDLSVFMRCDLA